MHGTFQHGDFLLITPCRWTSLRAGDVIVFRCHVRVPEEKTVMVAHRVRSRTRTGVITQSDRSSLPDVESVSGEDVVGRVYAVERQGKIRHVLNGRAGRIWVRYLRLRRAVAATAHGLYRLIRRAGVVRHLWRPRIHQVRLLTSERYWVKYTHGRRTVASWWPREKRFSCNKLYDLVITPPEESSE